MKTAGTITEQLRHVVESSGRADTRIAIVDRHLLLADGMNAMLRAHGFRNAVVVPDLRPVSILGFVVGINAEVALIDVDDHPSSPALVFQLVQRGIAVVGVTAGISLDAELVAFDAGAVGIVTTSDGPEQFVELILGVTTAPLRPARHPREPLQAVGAGSRMRLSRTGVPSGQRSVLPRRTRAGQ